MNNINPMSLSFSSKQKHKNNFKIAVQIMSRLDVGFPLTGGSVGIGLGGAPLWLVLLELAQ